MENNNFNIVPLPDVIKEGAELVREKIVKSIDTATKESNNEMDAIKEWLNNEKNSPYQRVFSIDEISSIILSYKKEQYEKKISYLKMKLQEIDDFLSRANNLAVINKTIYKDCKKSSIYTSPDLHL